MSEKKNYYGRLDILRIVSCVLVFLYHLNILNGGFLAVCTFFVLTGYLGCMSALESKDFKISKYYKNRFLKIYLPLAVVVLLTIIVSKYLPNISWINLKPESLSALGGYNNFWQLNASLDYFTRHINSPFMHLWYIAILLQFELVFPIAFVLLKKIDKKLNNSSAVVVLLLTIVSLVFFIYLSNTQEIMTVYYNTFARCFSILFGVLLAVVHFKYDIKLSRAFNKIGGLIYLIYICVLIALCCIVSNETINYALYMILATLISCRLISYATLKKSKENKIISYFAKLSYLFYLVQYPVLFFVQNAIKNDYEIAIITGITLAISIVLFFITNLRSRSKALLALKLLLICAIVGCGTYLLAMEEDHSLEMAELEDRLNDNLELIEQKNNEYQSNIKLEQEKWNNILQDMDAEESQIADLVTNLPVVGVGDSVLLAAAKGLYNKFPNGYFDGKVSRTILGGKEVLQELETEGKLGDIIITALANNGDYIEKRNQNFVEAFPDKEIYWVNAVLADVPEFNDRFKEFAKNYPNLHIVDWVEASKDHPEYFYADGIHVKGDGINAYAETVYNAIYNTYLEKFRAQKEEIIKNHEEELKTKVAFYGNGALTNCYSYLKAKFTDAAFNTLMNKDELYAEIEKRINDNTLEYNLYFIFDKEANITKEDFKALIDLCIDKRITIINLTEEKLNFTNDNVNVIDFYGEIQNNRDYLTADKVHLSEKGNEALVNLLK